MFGQQADEVARAVHGDARVLREEVARVVDLLGVRIDQGIVVGAVRLDLDLSGRHGQSVDNRSDELRQAAQRIAVLNELPGAVSPVAGRLVPHELRAREQLAHLGGGPHLTGMGLDGMNERRKGLAGREHRLRVKRVDP